MSDDTDVSELSDEKGDRKEYLDKGAQTALGDAKPTGLDMVKVVGVETAE